ncbi:MAG TPA: hypothetical protein EYP52_04215 [Anaerolineae bacterium]|nr:hypothetical protein [Anaerolineae bacterium]
MKIGEWIVRAVHALHRRRVRWWLVGNILAVVLVVLVVVLAVARLYLSGRIVVEARRLQEMRGKLDDLRKANRSLEIQIARHLYGPDLVRRAGELGLGPAEKIVVVEP